MLRGHQRHQFETSLCQITFRQIFFFKVVTKIPKQFKLKWLVLFFLALPLLMFPFFLEMWHKMQCLFFFSLCVLHWLQESAWLGNKSSLPGGHHLPTASSVPSSSSAAPHQQAQMGDWESVGRNNRKQKKKMQRVDPSILGFSVNPGERINMGEIQSVDEWWTGCIRLNARRMRVNTKRVSWVYYLLYRLALQVGIHM